MYPARGNRWRRAWRGVIFVMAFGWGTAIATAYETLGATSPQRDGPAMVTAGYDLIAVLVLGACGGIWRLLASEPPDLDPW